MTDEQMLSTQSDLEAASDGQPELIVFDFDGTLAEQRGSWGLLYRLFGTQKRGGLRTEAYRDGELTFQEWCDGNVEDWRDHGVTRENLERAANAIKLTTGAETLLSQIDCVGIPFGVLSSGVRDLIAPLNRFGPSFIRSNEIVYDDGIPVDVIARVGPDDKGELLERICKDHSVEAENVLYVGDSHSDVEAFGVAGTSVLFDPDDRIDESAYDIVDYVEWERDLRQLVPFVLA